MQISVISKMNDSLISIINAKLSWMLLPILSKVKSKQKPTFDSSVDIIRRWDYENIIRTWIENIELEKKSRCRTHNLWVKNNMQEYMKIIKNVIKDGKKGN